MKQSKLASWAESVGSTALGFGVSLLLQWAVCWWYDLPLTVAQNLGIIAIFTVASLLRGYVWRRICEHVGLRTKISPFVQAVIAERKRQIESEGWDAAHDDDHPRGEIAAAGAAYARNAYLHLEHGSAYAASKSFYMPNWWPWSPAWWKPTDFRRDLVKACALIVAEGEKHDRNRRNKPDRREASHAA